MQPAEAEFGREKCDRRTGRANPDALRESAGDLVKDQLREIEPVLQRIYETCDPHPALKAVRLVSSMFRGRGQLGTVIEDPENENARSDDPARIFSSSQINVLAVLLFLALNLTVRSLPLQCAILDDPLQSLDDLNLLGLVDVLRHVKDQRQMFISTHDHRFGSLLRRKLRPVEPGSVPVSSKFAIGHARGRLSISTMHSTRQGSPMAFRLMLWAIDEPRDQRRRKPKVPLTTVNGDPKTP